MCNFNHPKMLNIKGFLKNYATRLLAQKPSAQAQFYQQQQINPKKLTQYYYAYRTIYRIAFDFLHRTIDET